MNEELYVNSGGSYKKVDLKSPSGITLSFKSTLLNDLSKIESSKSYTFSLPKTANNINIFENVDDIRVEYVSIGKRYNAYFVIDGVIIIDKAYIYVETISNGFNAVMSWNVIDVLAEISDSDLKLNDLWSYDMYGSSTAIPNEDGGQRIGNGYDVDSANYDYKFFGFSNTAKALCPYYSCGLRSQDIQSALFGRVYELKPFPLPVVPVPYIIKQINTIFSCNFDLYDAIEHGGTDMDAESYFVDITKEEYETSPFNRNIVAEINDGRDYNRTKSDTINLGVVPCVKVQLRDEDYNAQVIRVTGMVSMGTYKSVSNTYAFTTNYHVRTDYLVLAGNNPQYTGKLLLPRYNHQSLKIDGIVYAWFKTDDVYKFVEEDLSYATTSLTLKFVQPTLNSTTERGSVTGIAVGSEVINSVQCTKVMFNFSSSYGREPIELEPCIYGEENVAAGLLFHTAYGIFAAFDGANPKQVTADFNVYPLFVEGGRNHPMNPTYCLPEITCFDFLKSLFYLIGAFPCINEDGSITAARYSDITKNISSGNCYDWSKYIIDSKELSIEYKSTWAQNNYYITGSDDETKDYTITEDGYADGKLNITNPNQVLDKSTVITKSPFYAPYTQNPDYHEIPTGGTFKYWNVEELFMIQNEKYVVKPGGEESKPSYGTLEAYETNDGQVRLKMNAWKGFKGNSAYGLLKTMFENSITIKVQMKIIVLDLLNIDYTKPVYIEKYNSYFAIVEIQWSCSTGISDVTLMKIIM